MANILRSGSVKHALGGGHKTQGKKELANADMVTGRPVDLLIARGEQWKAIVKGLLAYYEGISKAEHHEAKEIEKHANDLPLPFIAGAQFQQDGNGWQPALYEVKQHTRNVADLHEGLAQKIDSAVVSELTTLKGDIKSHVTGMYDDGVKAADVVDKERLESTNALSKLGHSIATVGQARTNTPAAIEDPFIAHSIVERQLAIQVQRENELQEATLRHQADSERFEKEWSTRLQKIAAAFDEAQTSFQEKIRTENEAIAAVIAGVKPDEEWAALTSHGHNYLIPKDAPIRDVNQITFPSQGHDTAQAVKKGIIERKTKFSKKYEEVYVVLTAAGFLHAYDKDPTTIARQDDPKSIAHPTLSLFLPACTLSAPSEQSSSKHKFSIASAKTTSNKNSRFKFGKNDKDFTFRTRSHEDMMVWHGAIAKLAGHSVSIDSTPTTAQHKGVVPSTVAGVGLPSEGAEEEEGSSEEEEEEEAYADAPAGAAAATENGSALPGYKAEGVVAPVEKKIPLDNSLPNNHTHGESSGAGYSLAAPLTSEPAVTGSAIPDSEKSVSFSDQKVEVAPTSTAAASIGASVAEPEEVQAA